MPTPSPQPKPLADLSDIIEAPRPGRWRQAAGARSLTPWLFLSPALVFGAVFFILPLVYAGYISLTRWNSLTAPRFVGLGNYDYLLTVDPRFWDTLVNTITFAAGSLLLGIPLGLALAYAFTRSRGQVLWRSIYWLPMVTNVVAVAFIWRFFLDERFGLLNMGLHALGLPGPGWLTDPSFAMISVIVVFVWMQLGHNMLLFSAGLANIDESYYEAARLDGASERQLFFRITVPLLKPTILFLMITNFISALSYFALMLVLTEGGPSGATRVTALYMYDMAFADLRLGRASAASFILFAFVLIVTLIQLRVFRRGGVEAH